MKSIPHTTTEIIKQENLKPHRKSKSTAAKFINVPHVRLLIFTLLIRTIGASFNVDDEKRFSVRELQECEELNNGTKCTCKHNAHRFFRISCPKLPSVTSDQWITILGLLIPDQSIEVMCEQMNTTNFEILPNTKIGGVKTVYMNNCMLTGLAPIAGMIKKLGLTNVEHLIYASKAKNSNTLLCKNELCKFNQNTFQSLNYLSKLDLTFYGFERMAPKTFVDLTSLTTIKLNFIKLKNMPNELSTTSYLPQLPAGMLSKLPSLRKVNLHWYLANIPADTFAASPRIEELHLQDNDFTTLPETLFNEQLLLRDLDLSHNQLDYLPDKIFKFNAHLRILKLNKNQLKNLSDETFLELIALEELYLNDNFLESLASSMFQKVGKLRKLHLQNNRLSVLDGNIFINYLFRLEVLNLSNNTLQQTQWKSHLPLLQMLDLSFNQITSLDDNDLKYTTSSRLVVDMSYNQISTIDFVYFPTRYPIMIMDLSNNPINCDCKLLKFMQFLRKDIEQQHPWGKITIDARQMQCAKPENLKYKFLRELSYMDLLCDLDQDYAVLEFCPAQCRCSYRSYDFTDIIDCSYGNHTAMPAMQIRKHPKHFIGIELNIAHNDFHDLPTNANAVYAAVTSLQAMGNKIKTLQVDHLPVGLTHLDLRFNQLTMLSDNILAHFNSSRKLKSIKLSGNAWRCDCSVRPLLQFIQGNYEKINDYANLSCSNGTSLHKLSITDICPEDQLLLPSILTWLLVFCLFVSLAFAFYLRYQMEIKVWLYAHNMCLWFVTEDELDKDKIYDAFISYSSKDEDFVTKQLVPNLEDGTPAFKVCVHYRDFLAGEQICTNIENAIANSRRTIVILSRNFIESAWARQEFRSAHLAALEERKPKVIVVLFDEIDNIEGMDVELQAYLKTNTYLAYDDPRFWNRLRFAMPHSRFRKPAIQSVSNSIELSNLAVTAAPRTKT